MNKFLIKLKAQRKLEITEKSQETVIVGDYVATTVFTENAYGFLIKDSKVAEGYKKYFNLLWKIAKS